MSDVHLGLDVKDPSAREARFVRFLKEIPADETEAVYLLGDIWDFWYEYRDVVPKGYVRVFSAILDLIDRGVKLYFFEGNHDIWCYGYFESLGMIKLSQPYRMEIDGKRFCIGHGDGLGPGNKGYKLMNRGFRCRFLQRMFSSLHPWFAFRIGNGWSRRSRLGKDFEYVFRGAEEPLWKFCEATPDVDYFIFGHYHVKVDEALPSGARLFVLKDWMEGGCYLLFRSGTFTWGGIS